MKRMLVGVLSCILLLSMTACNSQVDQEQTPGTSDEPTGSIVQVEVHGVRMELDTSNFDYEISAITQDGGDTAVFLNKEQGMKCAVSVYDQEDVPDAFQVVEEAGTQSYMDGRSVKLAAKEDGTACFVSVKDEGLLFVISGERQWNDVWDAITWSIVESNVEEMEVGTE